MPGAVNFDNRISKDSDDFVDNSFGSFRLEYTDIEQPAAIEILRNHINDTCQNETNNSISGKSISIVNETIGENYLSTTPFLGFLRNSLKKCIENVAIVRTPVFKNRSFYTYLMFSEDNTFEAKKHSINLMIFNSLDSETIKELKIKDIYPEMCKVLSIIAKSYSNLVKFIARFKNDPEFDRRYFEVHIISSEEPELVLQQEFEFKRELRKNFSRAIFDMLVLTYGWE